MTTVLLLNVLEKMNLKVPYEKVLMSLIKFCSHHWCLVSGTPGVISLSILPTGHLGKGVELICQVWGARGPSTANCGLWRGLRLAVFMCQNFCFGRHDGSNLCTDNSAYRFGWTLTQDLLHERPVLYPVTTWDPHICFISVS